MPDDLRKVRSPASRSASPLKRTTRSSMRRSTCTRQGRGRPSLVLSLNRLSAASAWCLSATTRASSSSRTTRAITRCCSSPVRTIQTDLPQPHALTGDGPPRSPTRSPLRWRSSPSNPMPSVPACSPASRPRVYHQRDRHHLRVAADRTVLASTPMGGIPILWKEGDRREVGRPRTRPPVAGSHHRDPRRVPNRSPPSNRWRLPVGRAQIDGKPGSPETYLRYVPIGERSTVSGPKRR